MHDQRTATSTTRVRLLDEAVVATLCIAEAAIVWLIFDAAFALPADAPGAVPPWVVIALMWGTAVAPRLLEALDVWNPWYQAILAAAVSVTTLASIKIVSFPDHGWTDGAWINEGLNGFIFRPSTDQFPVWGVIGLLAYAWWRGRMRAEPTLDAAFQMLKTGIVFTLIGATTMTAVDHDSSTARSAAPVLIFFTAAISAIGIARLAGSERQNASHDFRRGVFVALAPAALAAVLAIVIAGVFTRDVLDTLLWAIGPLLFALGMLFSAAILLAALIAMITLSPLFWLLDGRQLNIRSVQIDTTSPFANTSLEDTTSRANELPDAIRYVVAGVVLLLLFTGVTRFVLHRRKKVNADVEDVQRDTIRPVFDLRALFNALLRATGIGQREAAEDPLAGLRGDPRWASTIAIRERFAEYLVWSQGLGHARERHLTPSEHSTQFAAKLPGPGARGDVAELTEIYARARYRSAPAEPREADAANVAWQRLKRSAKSGT